MRQIDSELGRRRQDSGGSLRPPGAGAGLRESPSWLGQCQCPAAARARGTRAAAIMIQDFQVQVKLSGFKARPGAQAYAA
jgi:hypothetical protein